MSADKKRLVVVAPKISNFDFFGLCVVAVVGAVMTPILYHGHPLALLGSAACVGLWTCVVVYAPSFIENLTHKILNEICSVCSHLDQRPDGGYCAECPRFARRNCLRLDDGEEGGEA